MDGDWTPARRAPTIGLAPSDFTTRLADLSEREFLQLLKAFAAEGELTEALIRSVRDPQRAYRRPSAFDSFDGASVRAAMNETPMDTAPQSDDQGPDDREPDDPQPDGPEPSGPEPDRSAAAEPPDSEAAEPEAWASEPDAWGDDPDSDSAEEREADADPFAADPFVEEPDDAEASPWDEGGLEPDGPAADFAFDLDADESEALTGAASRAGVPPRSAEAEARAEPEAAPAEPDLSDLLAAVAAQVAAESARGPRSDAKEDAYLFEPVTREREAPEALPAWLRREATDERTERPAGSSARHGEADDAAAFGWDRDSEPPCWDDGDLFDESALPPPGKTRPRVPLQGEQEAHEADLGFTRATLEPDPDLLSIDREEGARRPRLHPIVVGASVGLAGLVGLTALLLATASEQPLTNQGSFARVIVPVEQPLPMPRRQPPPALAAGTTAEAEAAGDNAAEGQAAGDAGGGAEPAEPGVAAGVTRSLAMDTPPVAEGDAAAPSESVSESAASRPVLAEAPPAEPRSAGEPASGPAEPRAAGEPASGPAEPRDPGSGTLAADTPSVETARAPAEAGAPDQADAGPSDRSAETADTTRAAADSGAATDVQASGQEPTRSGAAVEPAGAGSGPEQAGREQPESGQPVTARPDPARAAPAPPEPVETAAAPTEPARAPTEPPTGAATAVEASGATGGAAEGGRYLVQVASCLRPENAEALRVQLREAGLAAYTVVWEGPQQVWHVVRVGGFENAVLAESAAGRIQALTGVAPIVRPNR